MREHGLQPRRRKRFVATIDSCPSRKPYPPIFMMQADPMRMRFSKGTGALKDDGL